MMNRYKMLAVAAVAAAMCFTATAQQDQNRRGPRPDQGQDQKGGDRGRPDPAQMRERFMERYKEALEITDDTEWKAIQPLVQKVMDARMAGMSGMGRMFGRRPGSDRGGDSNRGSGGMFGPASAETQGLERAVEAKAPNSELKAAIAKYNEARKAKQTDLEKAQNDLRKVLSVRQEALATLNGLL